MSEKKQKLSKKEREDCEFGTFGTWGFTHARGEDEEEYVPPKFSLKPLSPGYWHELPDLITPAQWQRAEFSRLQALERLFENGYIGYEEKMQRRKSEVSL